MSVTPLNCVLKALIFALNDSAEALVSLCVSFLHICSDGFQDADNDRHQQEWKDVVFSEFADQKYITNIGKNPSERPFYFSRTAKAALISYDKAPQTIYHSLCREQGLKSTVSVLESKLLNQPQRLLTHIRFEANGYPLEIEEILMTYGDKRGMATMTVFPRCP